MTYPEWLTAMVTLLNIGDAPGTAAFTALAPRFIEYGELRLQREIDFLATRATDGSAQTLTGERSVPTPTQFVVIEGVNLITPSLTKPSDPAPATPRRIALLRTSRAFIDVTWPVESQTQPPRPFETYYALFSENVPSNADPDEIMALPSSIIIAPTPDAIYYVEFTGTVRLAALSAANPNTFISTHLPDLFLAATMIIAAGYQRDFGAQSDDPKLAVSWETQYQSLRTGAAVEEARKAMSGAGWTAFPPPVVANTPRTGAAPVAEGAG